LVNSVRGNNATDPKGLAQRFRQLGRGSLPPSVRAGYEEQVLNQQKQLQDLIQKYIDSGCGDPPSFAVDYANRPLPAAPSQNQSNFSIDPQTQQQLVQGTATVGILGILLRVLGFGSLAF
jgi:hypothetical protein